MEIAIRNALCGHIKSKVRASRMLAHRPVALMPIELRQADGQWMTPANPVGMTGTQPVGVAGIGAITSADLPDSPALFVTVT